MIVRCTVVNDHIHEELKAWLLNILTKKLKKH